jgi:polysaccharide export outer membrane protein
MAENNFTVAGKALVIRAGLMLSLVSCLALTSCSSETVQVRSVTPSNTQARREKATTTPSNTQPAKTASVTADNEYRIQPLDSVQITVFNEPDLSVKVRVSAQGSINYPLLGSVQVGGLTVSETESRLKEQLGRSYLVKPQVNVLIDRANARRVFVLGQVKAPGAIDILADEGLTVVQAIARAGGFTDIAASDRVNILRTAQDGTQIKVVVNVAAIIKGQSQDIPLKPDDVLSVPETIF